MIRQYHDDTRFGQKSTSGSSYAALLFYSGATILVTAAVGLIIITVPTNTTDSHNDAIMIRRRLPGRAHLKIRRPRAVSDAIFPVRDASIADDNLNTADDQEHKEQPASGLLAWVTESVTELNPFCSQTSGQASTSPTPSPAASADPSPDLETGENRQDDEHNAVGVAADGQEQPASGVLEWLGRLNPWGSQSPDNTEVTQPAAAENDEKHAGQIQGNDARQLQGNGANQPQRHGANQSQRNGASQFLDAQDTSQFGDEDSRRKGFCEKYNVRSKMRNLASVIVAGLVTWAFTRAGADRDKEAGLLKLMQDLEVLPPQPISKVTPDIAFRAIQARINNTVSLTDTINKLQKAAQERGRDLVDCALAREKAQHSPEDVGGAF